MSNTAELIQKLPERLLSRVRVGAPSECWPWTGATFRGGYGRTEYAPRKSTTAHRVIYTMLHGPVASDLEICHTCDNRICVNPAHLFVGTVKDNAADKIAKGRHGALAGELAPGAKLKTQDVLAIRESKLDTSVVARQFGVSSSTIYQIRTRRIWRYV